LAIYSDRRFGLFTFSKYYRVSTLLWSGLCFVGLTVSNGLLVLDKLLVPDVDLSMWRLMAGLLAMLVLLYGLIWKAE
jgi:hypothetical protein